jgi:putative peptidoglycan lipid II flippase
MVIPESIISGLFERGAFTAADTAITAKVLTGYAFGLPSFIAIKVFSSAHWARQDTMTPVRISVIVTVTNIIFSLILIQFIGVAGIAISMGVTGWMQFAMHMRALKNYPAVKFDDRFLRVWPRIAGSTVVMAVVLLVTQPFLNNLIHDPHSLKKVVGLGVLVALGGAVYTATIFGTGVLKVSEIKTYFRKERASAAERGTEAQINEIDNQGI